MNAGKERPTLYLMVGLPGSGKTTVARELEKKHDAVRFTPDEWHLLLFGNDFHQAEEHDVRHDKVESLMWEIAQNLLRHGASVILDFGFWGRDQREEKRREARSLGAGFQIVYLDVPVEEIKRRIRLRNREGGDDVFTNITDGDIDEWAALFQPPDEAELAAPSEGEERI